jgi:hypothetical protein
MNHYHQQEVIVQIDRNLIFLRFHLNIQLDEMDYIGFVINDNVDNWKMMEMLEAIRQRLSEMIFSIKKTTYRSRVCLTR